MNVFYLKTFGCKLNQYESQLIRENLALNEWSETDVLIKADYLLINSCAVTSDAVKELRKFIRFTKRKNPNLKVLVLGCLVDLYPEQLDDIDSLKLYSNKEKFDLSGELSFIKDKIEGFKGHTRVFVKIQDGCKNRCSYCSPSIARSEPYSRNPDLIIAEIKNLLDNGYREVVLTGLCLGYFGNDIDFELIELLGRIERLNYDFRFRLSSVEPQDVNDSLIAFVEKSKKMVPHLHLPLQSGSDKILKLMNRKYDVEYFKGLILRLKRIDNFQFSTDVIVGFPHEEDSDFYNTLNLLEQLMPIRVHIFPFSPRPATLAYELDNKIPVDVITNRKKIAQKKCSEIVLTNIRNQINRKVRVLFEQEHNKYWFGYSENYIKVKYRDSGDWANKFVNLMITDVDEDKEIAIVESIT